jgi:hypothetical protein
MGYSNFKKMGQVTSRFGLSHRLGSLFPPGMKRIKPSRVLSETLERAFQMPLTNEKVKAEQLISPVLTEVAIMFLPKISLYSGEDLTVAPADDLAGPCDFFFALHPPKLEMEAPVISLAEAKDEDMDWGIAQCAAQMYAAHLFNHQHGHPTERVYGCATTGREWTFMQLENGEFTVDGKSLTEIGEVLAAWSFLVRRF